MGQAKRNKAQAVKSTSKQSIDKYMAWIVDAGNLGSLDHQLSGLCG